MVGDLLTGTSGLSLFDQRDGSLVIDRLREEQVSSARAAEELLREGDQRRHVGATTHNERSSRAHVICRLRIVRRATHAEPSNASALLNIVDLAGSERVSAHARGLAAGTTREGGHINQSLLVLSTVIQKLVEASGVVGTPRSSAAVPHVPFRSSKITRLLQTSLSGGAHTRSTANTVVTPPDLRDHRCLNRTHRRVDRPQI